MGTAEISLCYAARVIYSRLFSFILVPTLLRGNILAGRSSVLGLVWKIKINQKLNRIGPHPKVLVYSEPTLIINSATTSTSFPRKREFRRELMTLPYMAGSGDLAYRYLLFWDRLSSSTLPHYQLSV